MAEGLNDNFANIGLTLAAEYEEESCNIVRTTYDNINSFLCAYGDRRQCAIYRPISVLPAVSKFLKRRSSARYIVT